MTRFWKKPSPAGYSAAMDVATTTAAPLLAGFSMTIIVLVSSRAAKLTYPGATLLCVTVGVTMFVASLQCGFTARQYLYSASDVSAWMGENILKKKGNEDLLKDEQGEDFFEWKRWIAKARIFYNIGILSLSASIVTIVLPADEDTGTQGLYRSCAAIIATFAMLVELYWMLSRFTNFRSIFHFRRKYRLKQGIIKRKKRSITSL